MMPLIDHTYDMGRGSDAIALIKDLGADEAIDSGSDNAIEQLKSIAPDGIDAVLALAGGDVLQRCLDLVCPGGRVAYPNGVEPEPRHRKKARVKAYDVEVSPQKFARLAEAVEEGDLQVPIAEVFPLEEAAKAHRRIERGHVLGRIVLRIRD